MCRARALAFCLSLLVVVGLGALGAPASAQSRDVSIDAGHRRFADQYVAAARARDVERYKRLVHPQSLACFTKDNGDFFDDWTARVFRWKWDGPYRLVSVRAFGKNARFAAPSTFATYPVLPTHQLQIDVEQGPTRSATVVIEIVSTGGRWLQVVPCPTAEGLAEFRAAKEANAAQESKARSLAAGLAPALRTELTGLLKSGRRLDAMRRYAEATGEELAMAKRVIDILEAEKK